MRWVGEQYTGESKIFRSITLFGLFPIILGFVLLDTHLQSLRNSFVTALKNKINKYRQQRKVKEVADAEITQSRRHAGFNLHA